MTLFWINLPARADRRAHMEAQLRALGVAPAAHVRVDAYSPADLPALRVRGGGGRSASELACLCSHLEALRRAARGGAAAGGWALVAEDDTVLRREYDAEAVGRAAPSGAELLQLTNMNADTLERGWRCERAAMWRPWRSFYCGAQLYAVKLDAIDARLRALGVDPAVPLHEGSGVNLAAFPAFVPVADEYVFMMFRTVSSRVPFSGGDAALGSSIHEDHLQTHDRWWRAIEARAREPEVEAFLDGFARPPPPPGRSEA